MKVSTIFDDKSILLEVGDGVFVSVHSHHPGEIEIQFAGMEGGVTLTSPPFTGWPMKTTSLVYANYKPRSKENT